MEFLWNVFKINYTLQAIRRKGTMDKPLFELIRKDQTAKKLVEKFCALALLPANQIVEGFRLLKTDADEIDEFEAFLKYFQSYWITKVFFSGFSHAIKSSIKKVKIFLHF
jgi:hypothetical protein